MSVLSYVRQYNAQRLCDYVDHIELMIHDAIYFAMCRKFITRLSSVLTMLGHNDETAATTTCSIFATMICSGSSLR